MTEIIAYKKANRFVYINGGDMCQRFDLRTGQSSNLSTYVFADIKSDYEMGDESIEPMTREEVEELFNTY